MPLADSFSAISLEGIEECFKYQEISKFAYDFMAQCILQHVPAFYLGCIGSNNSTHVLQRWQYIFQSARNTLGWSVLGGWWYSAFEGNEDVMKFQG